MVHESSYWKDDLLRMAGILRRMKLQTRWSQASHAKVDKCLLLGFYVVRRLIEARKISDSLRAGSYTVTRFPARNEPITLLNWRDIDELYDLENGIAATVGLRDLCNAFVHSYVFVPMIHERGGLCGVFVVSEYERNESLMFVEANTAISIFERIGKNYPSSYHSIVDGAKVKVTVE